MDTDYLSIPTYNGLLIAAEKFNNHSNIQF